MVAVAVVAVVVVVLVVVPLVAAEQLVGRVVAMLLRVEQPPAVMAELRLRRAEDPVRRRVAVRGDEARELVVAVVLAETARVGVDRRGGVAALGDDSIREVARLRVVGV